MKVERVHTLQQRTSVTGGDAIRLPSVSIRSLQSMGPIGTSCVRLLTVYLEANLANAGLARVDNK